MISGTLAPFSRLESDTAVRMPLGAKVETRDGRIFRFVENSATAMEAGNLYQAPALVTHHQDCAVAVAAAINSLSVTVTLGATVATAGQYAEGYMVVNDEAGEGIYYKIKSNPAADGSASLVLTLEDRIKVALTTSSEVCLIPNPYKDVVISDTGAAGTVVGLAPFAIAASSYGWLQTHGVASAKADEDIAAGLEITIGTADTGAIELKDAIDEQNLGVALQAAVNGEHRAVFLKID